MINILYEEITCGQVEECIKEACINVKEIRLFDVYEGEQIPDDKKSMAFTVIFTQEEEALTSSKVDNFVAKILVKLREKLCIDLRS